MAKPRRVEGLDPDDRLLPNARRLLAVRIDEVYAYDKPVRDPANITWDEPEAESWQTPAGTDHSRAVASFLGAVRGSAPVSCTGEDGRDAVRLALASYDSARLGQPVRISG